MRSPQPPYEPGSRFVYSDAGFEVLGELVRVVSGETLDRFVARAVLAPLGMADTEFRPQESGIGRGRIPLARIAPTEARDGAIARGTVHDPRAFALGGVAGHAGLFGTADDLARSEVWIDNPTFYPDPATVKESYEPYIKATIMTPERYLGVVMELCRERRVVRPPPRPRNRHPTGSCF